MTGRAAIVGGADRDHVRATCHHRPGETRASPNERELYSSFLPCRRNIASAPCGCSVLWHSLSQEQNSLLIFICLVCAAMISGGAGVVAGHPVARHIFLCCSQSLLHASSTRSWCSRQYYKYKCLHDPESACGVISTCTMLIPDTGMQARYASSGRRLCPTESAQVSWAGHDAHRRDVADLAGAWARVDRRGDARSDVVSCS